MTLVVVSLIVCAFQPSSWRVRARSIKTGDSKARVEQLLGIATMITPFSPLWRTDAAAAWFCDTAETWAYGSSFDFGSEFPWLRFRFFLPDPDDIAVEFNRAGRVVRVTVPQRKS